MGLIDEYVEVELCSGNMKYYENLGYKIPKVKNLSGMWTTPRGTKIKVISKDLKKTSDVLVHAKCDACGEIIEISFNGYCNNIKRNSGKFICRTCATDCKEDRVTFKYEVGQRIITDKKDITITKRKWVKEKTSNGNRIHKYYQFVCNKCGFNCGEHYELDGTYKKEFWIREDKVKRDGCSCCCNPSRIIVSKINSIGITNPELVQYFKNKEDAYKHLRGSRDICEFKCPICGEEKKEEILTLYSVGSMGCTCGDGFSYPEKFMMECLKQLGIEFIWQLTGKHFSWIKRKRYDFYFELNGEQYIIETHGKQHPNTVGYDKSSFTFSYSNRRLEGKNDELKYNIAIENGIKPQNYIVIDCSLSEKEFISKNILKSKLNEIFDLSNINWDKCDELGFKNIVKQSCEMFNNGMNTDDIMKEFNISRTTVCRYLNIGTERNWCNYTGKEEQKKRLKEWSKNNINPLIVYDYKTNELIGIFDKIVSCIKYLKEELNISICGCSIYKVLNKEWKKANGLYFEKITEEEYYNYINEIN